LPTLRELLELTTKWIESIDPPPLPGDEVLRRLARYDDGTFLAGWLLSLKLEPRALELVALEVLRLGGKPSRDPIELVHRKERWQKTLKRARKILGGASRRSAGRLRNLPTNVLASPVARRAWLARAHLYS